VSLVVGGYLVEDIQNHGNDLNLSYNFLNGRPTSLAESLRVFTQSDRVRYDAIYGQDQWTLGRITLQGALRFDHAWSYSPPQTKVHVIATFDRIRKDGTAIGNYPALYIAEKINGVWGVTARSNFTN